MPSIDGDQETEPPASTLPSAPPASIIVGGGPGGTGPLIWAAQNGLLGNWLEQGVLLIERRDRLGGTLGRYGICSDSLGGSYLECLDAESLDAAFHSLRQSPTTLEMQRYRQSFPPLPLVDGFMRELGMTLADCIDRHPSSSLLLNTAARSLQLRHDGRVVVAVDGPGGERRRLIARTAIVALGGRQPWPNDAPELGFILPDLTRRRVMPSNILLGHHGLAEANELIAAAGDRRIVILGGSHSAYAVAWALLQLPAATRLAAGQIAILQRRPPRIFYTDREAAAADLYLVAPGDICPRTNRINRMGGLRGHGRDMWRQISGRPGVPTEPRVVALAEQDFSRAELQELLDDAALVVPCFGYRSATLPIYDSTGRRLALMADAAGPAVDEQCRLLLANGTGLANVFGVGLGTGFRPSEAMGCEPNFRGQANSLWLYQNDIGALIYRAIQAALIESSSAVAA